MFELFLFIIKGEVLPSVPGLNVNNVDTINAGQLMAKKLFIGDNNIMDRRV